MNSIDHPIFLESIRHIQSHLGETGLSPLEQKVLERVIHSSGDFSLSSSLTFSAGACEIGLKAIKSGATILTDTYMAVCAVNNMAKRTSNNSVRSILDWAPDEVDRRETITSCAMKISWLEIMNSIDNDKSMPIVIFGSSPTAMDNLLNLIEQGAAPPSLIVGMPVGFIGVVKSKQKLKNSGLPYILIEGYRGGASIAGATINALLRASIADKL